ncbi:MAG: hypothetical protein ACOX4I_00425 [Anaerovoracaceae bacterium]|jgi:hypothetical protein
MKLRDVIEKFSLGYFDNVSLLDISIHFDTVTALPTRRWQIKTDEGMMDIDDILNHGFASDAERERYKDMELLEIRVSHNRDRVSVAIALRNSQGADN